MHPQHATDIALMADEALWIVGASTTALFILIVALTLYFVVRYRRSRNPRPEDIEGNAVLEAIWVVIPVAIVLAMFYSGLRGYTAYKDSPDAFVTVKVTGQMWSWSFEYGEGVYSDTLKLPANRKARLLITSNDVIHSLFIPGFRLKADAVPGMTRAVSITPLEVGEYQIFCAEFCGTMHSGMLSRAEVVSEADFRAWLSSTTGN